MNRETKTIQTPIGNQAIELKAWLTGGEKRNVTNIFLDKAQFSAGEGNVKLDAELINKAQDLALKTVVVSIDGSPENIVEKILEMRAQDFDFIISEVNKITSGNLEEDVKKK